MDSRENVEFFFYLLDVDDVDVLLVDERENRDDCSRLSNSERKRVISSSILRISESKRSRIELNSESKTLKSPSLTGMMFLPAIFSKKMNTPVCAHRIRMKNDVRSRHRQYKHRTGVGIECLSLKRRSGN